MEATSPVSIRLADDLDIVRSIWTEYWAELGLPQDFQGFGEELRTLPGSYGTPRGVLALAYDDSVLAGTIALRPLAEQVCEVKRLYVRPRFRRRGIGRALMDWILQQAKGLGYRTVYGDTLPSMTDAMQMYRELGFEIMDHPYSEAPTPGAIYLRLRF
jgi:putative acetyltransferase